MSSGSSGSHSAVCLKAARIARVETTGGILGAGTRRRGTNSETGADGASGSSSSSSSSGEGRCCFFDECRGKRQTPAVPRRQNDRPGVMMPPQRNPPKKRQSKEYYVRYKLGERELDIVRVCRRRSSTGAGQCARFHKAPSARKRKNQWTEDTNKRSAWISLLVLCFRFQSWCVFFSIVSANVDSRGVVSR